MVTPACLQVSISTSFCGVTNRCSGGRDGYTCNWKDD